MDSGNGAHVYIPVEVGITEPAIKAAATGIKILYESDLVEIDTTVTNPSRLMRAPGSVNCKGAVRRPCVYLHTPEHLLPVNFEFVAGLKVSECPEPRQKKDADLLRTVADKLGYVEKKEGPKYLLNKCPFCNSSDKAAVIGRVGNNGGYYFKCHHNRCIGRKWSDVKAYLGLATGRIEVVKKVIKEQGGDALDMPEVQVEISKLKANGDLRKLEEAAREAGISYKALQAAARKPLAIAQDMAEDWIREFHIKTDKLSREIFYYENGVYIPAEDFIGCLIDERFRGSNTDSFIKNVLNYVRRHSLYEFVDGWLAVDNGVINPMTMEITGFSPETVTRIKLNVTYDPTAECPKWLKFNDECQADVTLLQEAAGYPLLPGYPHNKAIMLLGNGGQGKSVWMKVISMVLGADNVASVPLQTLVENRFGSADLYRRLANMAGDIPDMALSNTATFKNSTGDDRIRAEKKGQQPFDFWSRAKQIYSANQLPPSKDKTVGYMRRWLIIEFLREMVQNPNTHLVAELLAEKSGIFNWMLAGAKRVLTQGFTYTQDTDVMASKYILLSEPVVQFLQDCCKEVDTGFETSGRMHGKYKAWALKNRKKAMSSKAFVNAMKNQTVYAIGYDRNQALDDRPYGYFGVELIPLVCQAPGPT